MRIYTILEKIINKLGIDWIIENSNIDGWTVEKWHSGKMVQTLCQSRDNTGWSDLPYLPNTTTSTKTYRFPVSFISIPMVLASVTGGTGIGLGVTTHPSSTYVQLHVTGSQSCTVSEAKDISIIAIGKYK